MEKTRSNRWAGKFSEVKLLLREGRFSPKQKSQPHRDWLKPPYTENPHARFLFRLLRLISRWLYPQPCPSKFPWLCRDRRLGLYLDYSQSHSRKRLTCINTAFELFQQVGAPIYKEALSIIMDAWGGEPDSLRTEVVQGASGFVALFTGSMTANVW